MSDSEGVPEGEVEFDDLEFDDLRVALHRLLLVVLELRLQSLREREVLIPLRGDRRDVVLEDLSRRFDLVVLGQSDCVVVELLLELVEAVGFVGHALYAVLSSSTISASTTSSSSGGALLPPAPGFC